MSTDGAAVWRWGFIVRTGSPASRGYLRIRFSPFDTIWTIGSPVVALLLRGAEIFSIGGSQYCFSCVICSLIAYSAFRLHDGVSKFFSVRDAWNIVAAVLCAELVTCIALFTLTRLDNIPRSIPVIHALILCAGLIAARAFARLWETESFAPAREAHDEIEHVIMVGSTKLTFLFVKFLNAYCPGQRRIIALLDDRKDMTGRTVSGIRIVGPPEHLQSIVDEFAEHGVNTDRVVIGGDEKLLAEETLKEVRRVCEQRRIALDFVPDLIGLNRLEVHAKPYRNVIPATKPEIAVSSYFKWKYVIDFAIATTLLVTCIPLLIVAGSLAVLDVGWPMLFWQRRVGAGGRAFTIYKIRTLRPPFDQLGRPFPEEKRLSYFGRLLRRTRLDELPQLFNVLVGDMSLIGPRPLLPRDQPSEPTARLMVRPGVTGWAQVNGGTLLSPIEKDELDEWYVRNASVRLDLYIVLMTLRMMIWGQSRPTATAVDQRLVLNAIPVRSRRARLG